MLKFEEKRITFCKIECVNFKHYIPAVCVEPKSVTKSTVVFIFNGGIGSSIPACLYMNSFLYDNHYFVTYEKAGHNQNTNKPSQFKKNYLKELDEVVLWVRKKYPDKKIYLLGESWGTAINFIYYKKNKNKIDGTIGWNMPLGITNPEKKTIKQMYSIVWREIITLLFNIECHLPIVQTSQDKFCRDPLFRRMLSIIPPSKTNTKINISVWRFMKPCFNFIKKYGRSKDLNFMYIQSGEDIMADWKKISKLEKYIDSKHYKKFETGFHVLSMEPKESQQLFNMILDFISR